MANSISEYFTDEDLEQELRTHFDYDEMFDIDYPTLFSQIKDNGDCFTLKFRGKTFNIDYITGGVTVDGEDE